MNEPKQLTTTQAVVLGVVEGLTEYLPISSTGHLLVTKDLLGMNSTDSDIARQATETDAINAYLVCIQFGAILAILFVCAHRFKKILKGLFQGDADGRRLLINLILALGAFGVALERPVSGRPHQEIPFWYLSSYCRLVWGRCGHFVGLVLF